MVQANLFYILNNLIISKMTIRCRYFYKKIIILLAVETKCANISFFMHNIIKFDSTKFIRHLTEGGWCVYSYTCMEHGYNYATSNYNSLFDSELSTRSP